MLARAPLFRGPPTMRTMQHSQNHRALVIRSASPQGSPPSGSVPTAPSLGVLTRTGKLIPQGLLVKTAKFGWRLAWLILMRELAPQDAEGNYVRQSYKSGSGERLGSDKYPYEAGRYVLYLGNACPWCHRVGLALMLKGLAPGLNSIEGGAASPAAFPIRIIKTLDDPEKASRGGWYFPTPEPIVGARDLREVYDGCTPGGYVGRCTAPLLIDTATRTIVSNESADIVKMINDFPSTGLDIDLYPETLRPEIDRLSDMVYNGVNNGVYRSGFATSQKAYDSAQSDLWGTLREVDAILGRTRFLTGDRITLVDLQLLPTVARLELSYGPLFRCSRFRVRDFPNLYGWLKDIWQIEIDHPGNPQRGLLRVSDTVDLEASRRSYFSSLFPLNPSGIVPAGPLPEDLGLERESGRGPPIRMVSLDVGIVPEEAARASAEGWV